MSEPIFEQVNATHDLYRVTARLEARKELANELRKIQKPTKQVVDIIKRLEAEMNKPRAIHSIDLKEMPSNVNIIHATTENSSTWFEEESNAGNN